MTQVIEWGVRALVVLVWGITLAGVFVLAATGATGGCVTVTDYGGCVQPVFLGPAATLIATGNDLVPVIYTNVGGYLVLVSALILALAAAVSGALPKVAHGSLRAAIAALPVATTGIALAITAYYETAQGYPDAGPFVYAGLLVMTTSSLAELRAVGQRIDVYATLRDPFPRSRLIITGKWLGIIGGCVIAFLGYGVPWGVVHICMHGLCSGPFGGSAYSQVDGGQLMGGTAIVGGPLAQIAFLGWLAAAVIALLAASFSTWRPKLGQLGLYFIAAIGGLLVLLYVMQAWQHGAGLQLFDTNGDCAAEHALCTFAGFGPGVMFIEFGLAMAVLGGLLALAGRVRAPRPIPRTHGMLQPATAAT